MTAPQPEYAAPAVDKALDILELLADRSGGVSQLDIATAVGRSAGQIFRVLLRLERRGYVHRDQQGVLRRDPPVAPRRVPRNRVQRRAWRTALRILDGR